LNKKINHPSGQQNSSRSQWQRLIDNKEIIDLESIVADHIDQSILIQPFGASENR